MAKRRLFTEEDIQFLKDNYEEYTVHFRRDELARIMGRTVHSIEKKAKELGLTNQNRKYLRKWYE